MLAQVEALQLGGDGAFQRVEGEVRIAVLTFAQGQPGTGDGAAIRAVMAFSYVALPGEPAVVAALDHAVELGGHEVNHGSEL